MTEKATNTYRLPDGLPEPINDGACDHLVKGFKLPSVTLCATSGELIDLSRLEGTAVLYCYPRTGRPGEVLPEGWDEIPGARGCTPQACSFRDLNSEFEKLGVRIFGISTQDSAYQRELGDRVHLSFPLLSDEKLAFTEALNLPTLKTDGMVLIKRLTLIIKDGVIQQVFYPVFPPTVNAAQSLDWIKANLITPARVKQNHFAINYSS